MNNLFIFSLFFSEDEQGKLVFRKVFLRWRRIVTFNKINKAINLSVACGAGARKGGRVPEERPAQAYLISEKWKPNRKTELKIY